MKKLTLLFLVIFVVPLAFGITIPQTNDWTDHGYILAEGQTGEWDRYLAGSFTASAVFRDGSYYLYYHGSSDYSEILDSVVGRTIGVATSTTGTSGWTKSSQNPVIVWHPSCPANNCEEGAVSGGAFVNPNGDISIYYGANTEESAQTVNSDGRYSISSDGFNFDDQGIALQYNDAGLWGYGDEIFPSMAFEESGIWYVYYVPNNGKASGRTLGVAWGPGSMQLTNSRQVKASGASIPAWGAGGAARLNATSYVLFVSDVRENTIDVFVVDLTSPNMANHYTTYTFSDFAQGTAMLEGNTWYMFYRNANNDNYGVKTAPAGNCHWADGNCNGNIDISELVLVIQDWMIGSKELSELVEAIQLWKNG